MKKKPADDLYVPEPGTRRYVNGDVSPVYKRALRRIARRKQYAEQQKQNG